MRIYSRLSGSIFLVIGAATIRLRSCSNLVSASLGCSVVAHYIMAAAIGTGNVADILINMQEYARMAKRAATAVAGNMQRGDFDGFKWLHGTVLANPQRDFKPSR